MFSIGNELYSNITFKYTLCIYGFTNNNNANDNAININPKLTVNQTTATITNTTRLDEKTNINSTNNVNRNHDKELRRVLVVDDAISNRKFLCRLFKDETEKKECNYITDEAEDGKIALTKVIESMSYSTNNDNKK